MAPIISALLTIFGIMAFGFITERRKLFPQSMGLCLNRFVYWVSLPALLFTQMCTIPMDESTRALVWGGLAASFIGYAAFYFAFSLGLRKNGPEATLRTLGTCFPNAAFFGLPFVMMVYPGSDAAINATYGAFERLDNSSNFMSNSTIVYEDINGSDVTVDTIVYPAGSAVSNMNFSQGMLIYQALLYKQAHPEEDVDIRITSYRFSVQAGLCINRNSRYFGYMRQLPY